MSAIDDDLKAMGVQNWTLSRASLESDELHLSFYVPSGMAGPALEVGNEFEAGGWCGWVWSVNDGQRVGSGRMVEVMVKGVIGYLDSIPCPIIERDADTELVSSASLLQKAAAAAAAAGAGVRWSGCAGSVMTVPAGGSDSVWGVIRGVLKWMPDVRTAQDGRTLVLYGRTSEDVGKRATASVKIGTKARGTLLVAGVTVDLAALHEAEAGRFNWAASRYAIVARVLGGHSLVRAEALNGVLSLTARVPGEAGNELELSYYPSAGEAEGLVQVVSFSGGEDGEDTPKDESAEVLEGVGWTRRTEWSSARSLDDSLPPVVACRGGVEFEIPSGASIYQPGAFVYAVPFEAQQTDGMAEVQQQQQRRRVQQQTATWMQVKGVKVPDGWKVAKGEPVKMRNPGGANVDAWRRFWSRLDAFKVLSRVSSACLDCGTPVFEPLPADEAYPDEGDGGFADVAADGKLIQETSLVPANYKEFSEADSDHFYVLSEGAFPASSDRRGNVRGLKFCRGTLKQYVWLSSKLTGTAKAEEAKEFFSGQHVVDGKVKHYALLSMDAVFINRQRTRYQTGTNRMAEDDPAYDADVDSDLPAEEPKPDYYGALSQFWDSCQRAKLGGHSVTVYGVTGFDAAAVSLEAVQSMLDVEGDACRMTWDAGARTLTMQTGRREILGVDELLNMQMMGRRAAEDRSANGALGSKGLGAERWEALPEGPEVPEDEDDEPEVASHPMVSPSINAVLATAKNTRALEPFTLYQDEDGAWWISGGVLPAGRGFIKVPPKLVTVEVIEGRSFSVKARWDEASKQYKPKYIYYDDAQS